MPIVLDLDDTLYLERDYVRSGFKAVDQWLRMHKSFNDFYEEAWRLFEVGQRGFIFNMVLEPRGLCDEPVIQKLVEVYRMHRPSITLLPDAEAFLWMYQKQELALITDGPSVAQWAKIDALGIKKYINKIIVTDDLGPNCSKPNSEAFKRVQRSLPACDCIYIADNPMKDFIAPSDLGWLPSVRIRRAGSLHFDLPTPKHCIEAASFSDIDAHHFCLQG